MPFFPPHFSFFLGRIFCLRKNKECWYSVTENSRQERHILQLFQTKKEQFFFYLLNSHLMTPLKDLILVGGPKEKISPMFLLCLYESRSRNWSKASFPVCVTRPLLMNTVFSLNENISCFCLLLTPPIPTSCLIKINAIYEVELLVAFF